MSLDTESTAGVHESDWQTLCHMLVPEYPGHLQLYRGSRSLPPAKIRKVKNSQMSKGIGHRCVSETKDKCNVRFLAQ